MGAPGESNQVYTLSSVVYETPTRFSLVGLSKALVSPRGKGHTWASLQSNKIIGLATANRRSGPQSWDITHLFLQAQTEGQLPELLEEVSRKAASRGGLRVFMRLGKDNTLVETSRLSGFFPHVPEVLYRRLPGNDQDRRRISSDCPPVALREMTPSDEHDLFRLYNAATPAEVRYAVGMTFEQWMASHENTRGPQHKLVLEKDGAIRGWVGTVLNSRTGHLAATAHPDDEASLASIVDRGLESLSAAKTVYSLVPEYQPALQRILKQRGFDAVSHYVTLVKSTAITAKKDVGARVGVAST